jgi:3-hydroxyisobutyrate dehydrogenase-like beta-hydroxyacid dehydrogenase
VVVGRRGEVRPVIVFEWSSHQVGQGVEALVRRRAADGKAWVSQRQDGVQHLQWVEGSVISGQDAADVLETSFRLSGQKPYAILVDMTTIVHQSQEARAVFNADSRVIAAALLGSGPMDEILAGGAHTAVHPTNYFTSEHEAVSWIARQIEEARARSE